MARDRASVRAQIGYSRRTDAKPYFYANAHEKDFVPLEPVEVTIHDARAMETDLDVEGFALVQHDSTLDDLTDLQAVARDHTGEIARLIEEQTGCDFVAMTARGILRFSEKAGTNEAHDNSHPARFVHVDMSQQAAATARAQSAPDRRRIVRSAQYNVWRVLSDPPQDVPLALCAWPSVEWNDLIDCEAVFDPPGGQEFRFGNYLLAYNPRHRWYYYPQMHRGEAIIFKTSESDPERAQFMPHGAFDNPLAPADAPPRISLEMRGTAYWFG